MNTKPIPAILALLAGFVTCVMSFVQHIDSAVFAKHFIIVCVIFYIIGIAVQIVIDSNFKEMASDEAEEEGAQEGEEPETTDEESEPEGQPQEEEQDTPEDSE